MGELLSVSCEYLFFKIGEKKFGGQRVKAHISISNPDFDH